MTYRRPLFLRRFRPPLAPTTPGILKQVYTNGGSGEIVFNHTLYNYYFTQTGLQGGAILWVNGAVGFRVESGTTTLIHRNTITGNTTVVGGKLLLSKVDTVDHPEYSTVGYGAVTVDADGTLGGSGRVNGLTTVSGTLAPGNSAGAGLLKLAGGGLTLNSGSITRMKLGGFGRGTDYDAIDVTGALNFGGTLQLVLTHGFQVKPGHTFSLFGGSFFPSGTFSSVTLNSPDFAGLLNPTTGVVTIVAAEPVAMVAPEPSTFAQVLAEWAMSGWLRPPPDAIRRSHA